MPIQILNFLWLIYISFTFMRSERYSISDFYWIFIQLLSCDLVFLSSSYYIYLDFRTNYIIVHFCSCVLFYVQQYGWFKTARKSTTAQVGSLTHDSKLHRCCPMDTRDFRLMRSRCEVVHTMLPVIPQLLFILLFVLYINHFHTVYILFLFINPFTFNFSTHFHCLRDLLMP